MNLTTWCQKNKCHNDNTKMYQEIRFINRKPLQSLVVHGKAGTNVTEPKAVYNIIRHHFRAHFNDPIESKLEHSSAIQDLWIHQ